MNAVVNRNPVINSLMVIAIGIMCTFLGFLIRTIYIEIPATYATKVELIEAKKTAELLAERNRSDIYYIRSRIDEALRNDRSRMDKD